MKNGISSSIGLPCLASVGEVVLYLGGVYPSGPPPSQRTREGGGGREMEEGLSEGGQRGELLQFKLIN